jgi:transposase
MPLPPAARLALTDVQRKQLLAISRHRSTPRGMVLRISIVLGAAEGLANRVLARKLSTSVPTVLLWRKRYESDGLEGLLEERPRSGRPKQISSEQEAAIVEATMKTNCAASGCWGEAVASHHLSERCGIRWAAGRSCDDGGDFSEVVRAEDAGTDDREHLRFDAVTVVEAMDRSARYAEHLARADIRLSSIQRPGQHALEPVHRLLVTVMTVHGRQLRSLTLKASGSSRYESSASRKRGAHAIGFLRSTR